jgi:7-cyano-7-deazaguanine synthase
MQRPAGSTIGLLFSGGLDSSILLVHLLGQGHRVRPIYIHSGLVWQYEEFRAATRFLAAVAAPRLDKLVTLELPLADIYDGHWSVSGCDVPAAGTPDEAVYLPGRNPLLLIKARLWCQMNGVGRLALGCLSSNPFADATDDFFREFESLLDRAASGRVELVRPLATLDKRATMALGRDCPLALTFSCLAPRAGQHCGECNKCAERQAAFQLVGLTDPTRYAATSPSSFVPARRDSLDIRH